MTMTLTSLTRPAGQLTETCDITLTPITDKNGQSAVEEVKRCSLALDNSGGNISSVTSLTVSSSVIGNTIPPSTSMTTGTSPSTVTTATAPSNTQASTFPAGSPSTIPTGTSVFTTPAVPSITGTSSPVSSTPHASGTTTSTGPPFTNSPSGSGTAAADTTSSSSGVSAAASSSAKFEIPGKTISVLPIGLGVFAGISVIALIVVGLVTYERTKYRKVSGKAFSAKFSNRYFHTRLSDNEDWLNQGPTWAMVAWREFLWVVVVFNNE
ncbi:hypothetical protein C0989_002537 [Termitomyces sp. Mn162]|nr:hypothetical protein C0989_002537 [Termitomyces sp. Mn162]